MKYTFKPIGQCEMCGSGPDSHRLLGVRLNASQGLRPKQRSGIAVSVKRCRNCELLFSDPMPIPENFTDHYGRPPEDYWVEEYFNEDPAYFRDEIAGAKRLLGSRDKIVALDIGAGIGKAMKAMERAGFEVYGVEGSPEFRDRAISRMGIAPDRIKLSSVETADYAPGTFDLITLTFVLEHFYSPHDVLSRALRWLKPDGLILVQVPSSRYFMSKLINLYYRLRGVNYVTNISPMHSPYHLYEFSAKTFAAHGKRAGYKVIETESFSVANPLLPAAVDGLIQKVETKLNGASMVRVWLQPAGGAA